MGGEAMRMARLTVAAIGIAVVASCGTHTNESPATPDQGVQHHAPGPGAPAGYWDDKGQPVNGGPPGSDGSTGNNLTQEYCARHQNPACPIDSYVGPNAGPSPAGGG